LDGACAAVGVEDVLAETWSLRGAWVSDLTNPIYTGNGCSTLGITTTDRALGIVNPIPSDFNPRPYTDPNP
jgi:hypothetical protein